MSMKKKLLSGVLAAAMLGTMAVPGLAKDFPDTVGHWGQGAIGTWSDYGVVKGDDQGNFRPNDSVTRAETATILDNMIGYQKQSNKVFSDVGVNDWFARAVSRLYAAGVITGYEDGTIRPGANISRQEAAVMMGRAFGLETKGADTSVLNQFNDRGLVGDWAEEAVALMAERGYIQGSDGAFRPTDAITRAEIVTIVNNMVAVYADGSKDSYSGDYGDKIAVVKDSVNFNGVTLGGAVISPAVTGRVNFNSGSEINGHLLDLSADAVVNTSGADVSSSSSPNKNQHGNNNQNNNSGNIINGGSSGGSGGSGGGGGGGGSSTTKTYTVTFNPNGGKFGSSSQPQHKTYNRGAEFRFNKPRENPTRTDYTFTGWYHSKDGADMLDETELVKNNGLVTKNMTVYAGWERKQSKYGYVEPAKGKNICNYGKDASELMKNVEIASTKDEKEFRAVGELNYLSDYEKFPGLNKSGHFLALTYTLPDSVEYPEDAVLISSHGAEESEVTYSAFDEEDKTYTRVFYVNSENRDIDIIFDVDFDGDGNRYKPTELTVDICGLEFGENPVVSREVKNAEEFKNALAEKKVTDIVVKGNITLNSGEYVSYGNRKTVTVEGSLALAGSSDVTLKNIDFKTPDKQIVPNLITSDANKNKTFVFENNTVTGAFACVLPDILSGNVTIKDNTFVNTYTEKGGFTGDIGSNTCLTSQVHEGEFVVTGNSFDKYGVAVTYAVNDDQIDFTKNKFLDNVTDIAGVGTDTVHTYAYNYFKDEPKIDDVNYVIAPVYTDEDCTKESENTETDAFLVISSKETRESSVRSLAALNTLYLKNDADVLTVRVVAKDARDAVVLTGGTEVPEKKNTVTLNKDAASLSVKVGEAEAKELKVMVSQESTEADVYISAKLEEVQNKQESAKLQMEKGLDVEEFVEYNGTKSLAGVKDSDMLYVGFVPADAFQSVKAVRVQNSKGDFIFACKDNIAAIPGVVLKADYAGYGALTMSGLYASEKQGKYKVSFSDVEASETQIMDPKSLVGEYTFQVDETKFAVKIAEEGGEVKSQLVGEVGIDGEQMESGSLSLKHFYGVDGKYDSSELKVGSLFLEVGEKALTVLDEAEVNTANGKVVIPAGTVAALNEASK